MGSKNFKTEFDEEINEIIQVIERGERRSMSKRRAALKKLFSLALNNGNTRALDLILKYDQQSAATSLPDESEDDLLPSQSKRLEDYVRREAKRLAEGDG